MHAIDNEDGIIQIKSFRSKEQGGERERERRNGRNKEEGSS